MIHTRSHEEAVVVAKSADSRGGRDSPSGSSNFVKDMLRGENEINAES